ncbi:MAG: hypothetical protein K6E29_07410 [Cyanobacteria bacterium RUI128]|nr:hypothetical protein [Cyanobacteria bacterium RUI128]
MTNNFYNINIRKYNPPDAVQSGNFSVPDSSAPPDTSPTQQNLDNTVYMMQESSSEQLSHSRLNALDSTILVNEAYQNIDDDVFRKEYQIEKLEEELRSIENEIEQAKAINDLQKVDVLTMRRRAIRARLTALSGDYGNTDMSAKLSDGIASVLTAKPKILSKVINGCVSFMSEKILPKISKKYDSGRNIKTALSKLETLNKNVDELVTMQTPYGEADERYDMLTNYLNRANVIHYNISKTVGTPTFFDTISSIDKEKYALNQKGKVNFGRMTGKPQTEI